jgi:two-component system heavy metal sensor histidine kinase CusS
MRSLRIRLTVLFALVTSLSIAAVGVFLDYSLSMQLVAREREQLAGKIELFSHLLAGMGTHAQIRADDHRFAEVLIGHGDLRAAILEPPGPPVLELHPFSWPAELVAGAARGQEAEGVAARDGKPYRVLVSQAQTPQGPVLVALAQDITESRIIVSRFRTTIVLACVLASLATGALGYFAAVRGLYPLRVMSRAAARISAERLHERLALKDVPRELRDMAESFNGMLARLEESFRRLSEFSSDLAHELRTPLTNLMLQAQVALDKPRNQSELREVLESGLEELERLSRTVNDMLFLAKADHAQLRLDLQPLPLEEETEKIFEYFEPLASERGVRLERQGSAVANADRAMIRRVLANLVSNALRYAEPESAVRIRLSTEGRAAIIDVENTGLPISGEDRARVFDRFFRTEASRGVASEGAGLGLAIVKSIVELHGGKASAMSEASRTTFRVTLQSPDTGPRPVAA